MLEKAILQNNLNLFPALTTITAKEEVLGALASDIIKDSKDGKVLFWNWFKFPGGEASSKKFSDTMQAYVGKKTNQRPNA